jgi:hypothetical protein
MNTNTENQEATYNEAYNPFPEPQTIPSGWDTSTLSCQPQTASALDEEDPGES